MNGMNGMNGTSGRRYHPASLFFALVDGLLILTGVLAGLSLRFWNLTWSNLDVQYLTLKITFFVLVVQLAFYYFDLYEFRCFREKKRMAVLLLESLGASSIVLAVLYYLIPHFVIGRGVFAVSICFILCVAFVWRVCFAHFSKAKFFKERVLIIGTGDLAKKIKEEISDNAYDSFEILGFIDEHGEKVDQRIGEGIEERVAEERA
jgi:FlaA1/EpsC-like NDP-sugar epimerase